jgi:hypothetical protein
MTMELSSKRIELGKAKSEKKLNFFQRFNSWLEDYAERGSKKFNEDIKNGHYPFWQ